jgi:hypothetical protein
VKIYVASSWRNASHPVVVKALTDAGHDVYDFRNPYPGNNGFQWSDIDGEWYSWTPEQYRHFLDDPIAQAGFRCDIQALQQCECVVGVQPFGRSASLELGWAAGAGKLTILLLAPGEPELMVKMWDHICLNMPEVLTIVADNKAPYRPFGAERSVGCRW